VRVWVVALFVLLFDGPANTAWITAHTRSATIADFLEAATGVFRPIPVLGAMSSLPSNAIYFGSILGYQRLCCKTLELMRRREDYINELFGFGMIYPYYRYILNHSEKRLARHNRIVGGTVILSLLYSNFFA